jgi:hypothetical protein
MARRDLARRVFQLVGDPPLHLVELGDGWPSLGRFAAQGGARNLALHVSQAGNYFRQPHEYRFQNPAERTPVDNAGGFPILLGVANGKNVILIGVDGRSRVGRETRFSILFDRNIIPKASQNGFSQYRSGTGELIYAFQPALFGTFVEIVMSGVEVEPLEIVRAAKESGFLDDGTAASAERVRRATQVLVRHYAFGERVKDVYGSRCAMCGMTIRLVAGAHIYPASAPDSPDRVWNGIALCPNHHAAFDNHELWIDPETFDIRIHPAIHGEVANPAVAGFVGSTYPRLVLPEAAANRPRRAMFEKRYAYFAEKYDWAN